MPIWGLKNEIISSSVYASVSVSLSVHVISCDFQTASPRKSCGCFLWNGNHLRHINGSVNDYSFSTIALLFNTSDELTTYAKFDIMGFIMGITDSLLTSKWFSAEVLCPISVKLHSAAVLPDTTLCCSFSWSTHFFATGDDLWTWPKTRALNYKRIQSYSSC
jgi:hypothetical protein